MQAIVTKYFGPGNVRGSRVKATCQAGSVTVPWDDALNSDGNHTMAARKLAFKLGWNRKEYYGKMVMGAMPDGSGNVFVFTGKE